MDFESVNKDFIIINETKGGGVGIHAKCKGWADRRVSMVGGGRGGLAPPSPRNGKKDAVRGID